MNSENRDDTENRKSVDELALEAGAPGVPPLSAQIKETPQSVALPEVGGPAGFWIRALAYAIDWIAISIIVSPIQKWILSGWLAQLSVMFFYFGWFYAEKGASPGKLIFGLEVRDSMSSERLKYGRSFFRETIGKFISLLTLGLGFFIVLVRPDRKALHDMLVNTQVRRVTKV